MTHPNSNYGIFMTTSHFSDFTLGTVCITHFSGVLASFLTLGLLYSFNAKVLRVLFQLESPNSKHRNSSYDLDTRDYSMFKTETRIWLEHGPTLSEFLGYLESEFDNVYFLMFDSP